MKTIIEKLENLVAELKNKEAEMGSCAETCTPVKDDRVLLSTLAAGQKFKTDIGKFIVLAHDETGTKVIQDDFFEEDVKFDDNSFDYTKSDLKKKFDTEILEAYEKEFGINNLVEHEVELKSVDMQDYGSFTCKARPISFDEAREFNQYLAKPELSDYWWTCTPWSTKERGWDYSVSVVSPSGGFGGRIYYDGCGVRPFCILKSNIFVSRVED